MTDNDFFNVEMSKKVKENLELKERIQKLENLILHLKNKFLNIMNNVDRSGYRMIEHVIKLIDENVQQVNVQNKSDSKFNNYLKNKISKD